MKLVYLTDKALTEGIKTYELADDEGKVLILVTKDGAYRAVPKEVNYVHRTREDAVCRMTELVLLEQIRLSEEITRLGDFLLSVTKEVRPNSVVVTSPSD